MATGTCLDEKRVSVPRRKNGKIPSTTRGHSCRWHSALLFNLRPPSLSTHCLPFAMLHQSALLLSATVLADPRHICLVAALHISLTAVLAFPFLSFCDYTLLEHHFEPIFSQSPVSSSSLPPHHLPLSLSIVLINYESPFYRFTSTGSV